MINNNLPKIMFKLFCTENNLTESKISYQLFLEVIKDLKVFDELHTKALEV
jgi:hypothetical protein